MCDSSIYDIGIYVVLYFPLSPWEWWTWLCVPKEGGYLSRVRINVFELRQFHRGQLHYPHSASQKETGLTRLNSTFQVFFFTPEMKSIGIEGVSSPQPLQQLILTPCNNISTPLAPTPDTFALPSLARVLLRFKQQT